jgi:hypothetical protein
MPDNIKKVQNPESEWMGITGLVLSIVGLIMFFGWPFTIVLSIAGIVFSILQMKKNKSGISIAGLIVGIVGFLVNLVILILWILALLFIASFAPTV